MYKKPMNYAINKFYFVIDEKDVEEFINNAFLKNIANLYKISTFEFEEKMYINVAFDFNKPELSKQEFKDLMTNFTSNNILTTNKIFYKYKKGFKDTKYSYMVPKKTV